MSHSEMLPKEVSAPDSVRVFKPAACAGPQPRHHTPPYAALSEIPIPAPRQQVMRWMRTFAAMVGGPVDVLKMAPGSVIGLRLPLARITILGTACSRPLLFDEAQEVQRVLGEPIIIVRPGREPWVPTGITFDALPLGGSAWLERLRLWQQPCGSQLALVPSGDEGRSLLVSPWRLDAICSAPFYSALEREAGFQRATASLRRVAEGQ